MIGGIAEFSEHEKEPEHSVIPACEEEFGMFLSRLRSVSHSVLTLRDWELLLTAAERLIPRKAEPSDEVAPALAEFWKLAGSNPPAKRVEPVDLDLDSFAAGWKGNIIRALLEGFSSKHTFENSQRFGADEWIRLLERFYSLTGYLSPPIYPSFTAPLCQGLSNDVDSIRLANLINSVEPLVLKQRITRSVLEGWTGEIEAEATHLKDQGERFEPGDDPYDFDQWHSKCEKFLATAASFSNWSAAEVITVVEELSDVFQSARRPREEEYQEEDQQELPQSGPYWTVDRLFEDL